MRFLADLSRELICDGFSDQGLVRARFDPSKATLIFRRIYSGGDESSCSSENEQYFFITQDKRYFELTFERKGMFRKHVEPPSLKEHNDMEMLRSLRIFGCPIDVIEKHFGRQEVA